MERYSGRFTLQGQVLERYRGRFKLRGQVRERYRRYRGRFKLRGQVPERYSGRGAAEARAETRLKSQRPGSQTLI